MAVVGNRPKWTPTGPKPLHRPKPNSTQFITLGGTPQGPKTHHQLIKEAPPKKIQHISCLLVFLFSFVRFMSPRPAKSARPILTILPEEIQKCERYHQQFIPGNCFEKTLPRGISSQNTLLNNVSPVQPILVCSIPIDSARQAKTHRNIKHFPDFILKEQPGNIRENYPLQ
jgi:hypothetical protein